MNFFQSSWTNNELFKSLRTKIGLHVKFRNENNILPSIVKSKINYLFGSSNKILFKEFWVLSTNFGTFWMMFNMLVCHKIFGYSDFVFLLFFFFLEFYLLISFWDRKSAKSHDMSIEKKISLYCSC
jgi:hypothetical protein